MGFEIWIAVIIVAVASVVISYVIKRLGEISANHRTQSAIEEVGEPESSDATDAFDHDDFFDDEMTS